MQQSDIEEPNIQAARHTEKITIFLPAKMEQIDAIIQNAREQLEIPVEPAMPCVTRSRISTAKTPMQKVAVSKVGGGRPLALSEGRLSLTKNGRVNRSVRTPKVYSSQRAKSFA